VYLKMEADCRSDTYICIEMSGLGAWKGTWNSSEQGGIKSRSRRKVLANLCVNALRS
jgi:hypothetical protein